MVEKHLTSLRLGRAGAGVAIDDRLVCSVEESSMSDGMVNGAVGDAVVGIAGVVVRRANAGLDVGDNERTEVAVDCTADFAVVRRATSDGCGTGDIVAGSAAEACYLPPSACRRTVSR